MSELRQNLASKEWVVIAPERKDRPDGLKTKISSVPLQGNEYEPDCPFCPGNEKEIPVIEKHRIDNSDGKWIVRVIDNKYKILNTFKSCPLVPEPFEKDGIYQRLEGCGSHELVIETNKHNKRITDLSKNNPDFNFVIRTAPYPMDKVPFYHWFIQFLPRTKILGGFERGTRIQVNTVLPELSAKMLRECRTC